MNRNSTILTYLIAAFAIIAGIVIIAMPSRAESLNIRLKGGATYNFGRDVLGLAQIGNQTVDGQLHYTLTIGELTYLMNDIEEIYVSEETLGAKSVNVNWTSTGAEVLVSSDVAPYVTSIVNGGNVTLIQSEEISDEVLGEITYTLAGESADGSLSMTGGYKATLLCNGLNLTSKSGAAILIDNGKRIAFKLNEGTTNRLADSAGGTQKGALDCKGHLEFKGKGALEVTGNTAHGIFAKEYITIKNSNITVPSAVKDGMNCNQYFSMESGVLTIQKPGDDGLQVSYKDATDREAEDTGSITITGGTLNINASAKAAKAIKSDNNITISGGTLNLEVTGVGMWDATAAKTKAAACIGADGDVEISGGTFSMNATAGGGKGISCDGALKITEGVIKITTSGALFVYQNNTEYTNYTSNADRIASNNKSSAKGIKADGAITISGGDIAVHTTGYGTEAIESKSTITIDGGKVQAKAYDDAINSSSHLTVNGGEVTAVGVNGDGLDANGNLIINGGTVYAFGGRSPECGLDANSEGGYTVILTGGTILAAGGGNSVPTTSASTWPFIGLSNTTTAGTVITVKDGETELGSFTVPSYYGTTESPVTRGPGGWGGGGGMGSAMVIAVPGMVSGKSYTVTLGSTTATATAKLK